MPHLSRGLIACVALCLPAPALALSLPTPAPTSTTTPAGATLSPAAPQQLELVEHVMPLMAPHLYESVVQAEFADRGEIIRWYIARVDEATSQATAEVVILPKVGE